MKNRLLIITLLAVSSIISSCSADDDFDYQEEFEKSQKNWIDFKETTDDSYKYIVSFESWTGTSWETTIHVSNGIVTQRFFKYTATEGLSEDISEEELEWIENEDEIGTHTNGAEPITMDEVYNKAEKDWLIKSKSTQTYFETENNGMISTCGYNKENCIDDCFIGIHITNIESL